MDILELKAKIKSNPYIKTVARYFYIFVILYDRLIFLCGVINRKKCGKSKKYYKLRGLKNTHVGERCFIVSTGPSLTIEDLEKLENEITFSMNSVIMAFDETSWRPTFYGIQDEYVCKKMMPLIKKYNVNNILIGSLAAKYFDLGDEAIEYPLDLMNAKMPFGKHKTKFSDDCFLRVYDGHSVTYSMLQIAVYMGFKKIYLLGNDCSYFGDKKHFREHGIIDSKGLDGSQERLFISFEEARKFSEAYGIEIFNATRGGALEIFPRVDLDSVLNSEEDQK